VKAEQTYRLLKERAKNELLQQKLDFLVNEETRHGELWRRFYSRKYSQQSMSSLEVSFWPEVKVALAADSSVEDLFAQALENEKVFEDFYRAVNHLMKDPNLGHVFQYLSRGEGTHYFIIKAALDLPKKFPDSNQPGGGFPFWR